MGHDQPLSTRIFEVGARHPRPIAILRIAVGVYLLVLTGILTAAGVGNPWAGVTGVFAVVHFVLAYRLLRGAQKRPVRS